MEFTVSKFYNEVQFPGYYTQDEILEKCNDFFLSPFLKMTSLPFKAKILDAGCGTGYSTHVIAKLRRDSQLMGIDFSKKSLEFAVNF